MPNITEIKTNFTAGELSPDLIGRGDLRAYDNGAATLRNVFIDPTGGVTRRAGLSYVDAAAGPGKLISFEFNTEQTYLIVMTNAQLAIYADGAIAATVAAPWTTDQISQVCWTQSADTLLLTHPGVPPKKLTRNPDASWTLADWSFFNDNGVIRQPYFKFADTTVTLTPSATTGTITVTASASVFTTDHNGTRLKIGGQEVLITDVASATVITATVIETLAATTATIDWEEQAFSAVHGYPTTVAFHQSRLVIGGSRDMPNRMWFSKSDDLFNFDLGTGLDDDAIEFTVLSDQVNAIRGLFSGDHLQVFTSGAEWMVSGDPLTPTSVQILRQTRIGSRVDRYVPPVNVDGATLFVARNQQEIEEFIYSSLDAAYQTTDVGLLSRHIVANTIDQAYDPKRRLVFTIREDGLFATLTVFRSEEIAAWTLHQTTGNAIAAAAVVGDDVYLLVQLGSAYLIELFDDSLNLDSALTGTAGSPTLTWSGLDYLDGQTVSILADGFVQSSKTVASGSVTLDSAAENVEIGLSFTHTIQPLPPNATGELGSGAKTRLVRGVFRLMNTAALKLDVGQGLTDVSLKTLGGGPILDAPPPQVSGDLVIRALGWQSSTANPLWRIEQDVPLPFTLLSVMTEVAVNPV